MKKRQNCYRTMKLRILRGFGIAAAVALMLVVLPSAARAAVKDEGVLQCTYRSGYQDVSRRFTEDITGDGKKDVILAVADFDSDYNATSFRLRINGTQVLTYDDELSEISGPVYSFSFYYVKMTKKISYLQIIGTGEDGYVLINGLYSCSRNLKLTRRLDLTKYFGTGAREVVKASSKRLTVSMEIQPVETGRLNAKFRFTRKGRKLKLASRYGSVKSEIGNISYPGDGYEKYFAKNKFVVNRNLRFVTKVGGKKTAFTAKKGNVLKLNKCWFRHTKSGNVMWLRFSKSGQNGWVRVLNPYSRVYREAGQDTGWFRGTYCRLSG